MSKDRVVVQGTFLRGLVRSLEDERKLNQRGSAALRVGYALLCLGLVLVTFWFGATIASRDTGIVAALLLLASPGVFALARYAILDTLFTLFLFGGAALLAVAALRERPRLQWPGYLSIALAVTVKGPVALAPARPLDPISDGVLGSRRRLMRSAIATSET